MKKMKTPYKVIKADGVYLYTENNKMIDSISSWWSVIHGYNHPELNKSIKEQMDKFSHVMLGGLTHNAAQKLSRKLETWLPGDLNYCFYSDSGSVGVEVALKMALQYYINQGETQKTKILALKNAYHGDTFKTMEVGDDSDYHFVIDAYGQKQNVIHISTDIPSLEEAFKKYHDELNCLIVEPLLQCAGGMKMYDISFLHKARELCDKYNVLLIFDEVATGFGRTGNRFVADLVTPDIIVLGKALTAGYIGHSVTVANTKVYKEFYNDDNKKALMHGPTFMGNALACSIALKSIEIFEQNDYMSKIHNIEKITFNQLSNFKHEKIKEIRIMGGCMCIEVFDSNSIKGFQDFAYKRGMFSRPFLNYLYTMVPYVITENELTKIINIIKEWFQ